MKSKLPYSFLGDVMINNAGETLSIGTADNQAALYINETPYFDVLNNNVEGTKSELYGIHEDSNYYYLVGRPNKADNIDRQARVVVYQKDNLNNTIYQFTLRDLGVGSYIKAVYADDDYIYFLISVVTDESTIEIEYNAGDGGNLSNSGDKNGFLRFNKSTGLIDDQQVYLPRIDQMARNSLNRDAQGNWYFITDDFSVFPKVSSLHKYDSNMNFVDSIIVSLPGEDTISDFEYKYPTKILNKDGMAYMLLKVGKLPTIVEIETMTIVDQVEHITDSLLNINGDLITQGIEVTDNAFVIVQRSPALERGGWIKLIHPNGLRSVCYRTRLTTANGDLIERPQIRAGRMINGKLRIAANTFINDEGYINGEIVVDGTQEEEDIVIYNFDIDVNSTTGPEGYGIEFGVEGGEVNPIDEEGRIKFHSLSSLNDVMVSRTLAPNSLQLGTLHPETGIFDFSNENYVISSVVDNNNHEVDVVNNYLECATTELLSNNEFSISDSETLKVYPNPSNHKIRINSNTNQYCKIYSLKGELVLHNFVKKNQSINVSELNAGIYVITIDGGERTKFIKY